MEQVWKILIIGACVVSKVTGQDTCTWLPTDLSGRTHVTGSNAEYFINSTTTLRNFAAYTWYYNSSVATEHTYSSTSGSFSPPVIINTRVETSATKLAENLVVLSARVKAVTDSDNQKVLRIQRNFCDSGEEGARVTLTVKECDRNPYGAVAVGDNFPPSCGLDCKVNFNCTAADCGTFEAECLVDATWNPSQHNCSSTCAVLPPRMVFTGGATSVACGMAEKVTCNGTSAEMCGSTMGRCTTRNNIVALDNETFSCIPECDVNDFIGVAVVPAFNPVCGEFAEFQCLSHLVCEPITFTRQCGQNGVWKDTTSPCFKYLCDKLAIEKICGKDLCDYGNVSEITCGEPLNYTCKPDKDNVLSAVSPVYCNGTNTLNVSFSLCQNSTIGYTESTSQGSNCSQVCSRLKDAWIAFIVLMPLWLVEFIVLIFLTRQDEEDKSVHWISCSVDALKKCYAWKYWTTFRLLGAIPGSVVHIIGVILIGVSASSECCVLVTLGVAGIVVSCGGQVYILVFIFGALCIVPVNKVVPEAVELNANQTPDA